MSEPIDEPVPKLPRGRGLKFSGPEIFRIVLTLATLIGVVVLARPCANAVSGFVTSFDGSATEKQMPKPGNVDVPPSQPQMEVLRPDMTEEELKAAIERSKARAMGGSGASGAPSGASGAPSGASGAPSGASGAPSGSAAPGATKETPGR